MKLAGSRMLVTGASGGIGRALALELGRRGARLALSGRDETPLAALAGELSSFGACAAVVPHDLSSGDRHAGLVRSAAEALGGLDVLINNAGTCRFGRFADLDEAALQRLLTVNVMAPLELARAALPRLLAQGSGCIVNIGSVYGAIAFPYFTAYSACKFALRGFSEALRRELDGTGVRVVYVAPRATATAMNGAAVRSLMAGTGVAVDAPGMVAARIADAIERERAEVTLGSPEGFFTRVNAVLPRVVDRALRRHARAAARLLAGGDS